MCLVDDMIGTLPHLKFRSGRSDIKFVLSVLKLFVLPFTDALCFIFVCFSLKGGGCSIMLQAQVGALFCVMPPLFSKQGCCL